MTRIFLALVLAFAPPVGTAWASGAAFDEADDQVYVDGWQTGDDGGFGWGDGWLLDSSADRGYSVSTSTANGDGDSDGDGDIDSSGSSWCAFSEGAGVVASARRRLAGSLEVGQLVAADLDYDPASGEVVFALQGPTGTDRFRFTTSPSGGTRLLDAGTLDITSVLPASDEGLFLEFVLTGHDTYTLVLIPGGGGTSVEFERTLAGTGWIDRLEFLASAETTAHREAFLNRIAVPEPGAGAALSALGALLLATRRRAR